MMTNVDLPEGWVWRRLKYLATYNDEVLPESTDDLREIAYVEISGVSLTGGIEDIKRMTFFEAPSRARRKVRSGDILISTVRTYLRAIASVTDDASDDLVVSTGFCVLRSGEEVNANYLGWVVKSEPFIAEVVARSVGVSYPAISSSQLVTIRVSVPPPSAQCRIASFLDKRTTEIDHLLHKMTGKSKANSPNNRDRSLLGLLSEYRSALVTAAVTGQIKELQ